MSESELVVWETFTAGDGHPGLRTRPATVEDIQHAVESGTIKGEEVECLFCEGMGEVVHDIDCEQCVRDGGMAHAELCPECRGSGGLRIVVVSPVADSGEAEDGA